MDADAWNEHVVEWLVNQTAALWGPGISVDAPTIEHRGAVTSDATRTARRTRVSIVVSSTPESDAHKRLERELSRRIERNEQDSWSGGRVQVQVGRPQPLADRDGWSRLVVDLSILPPLR